MTKIEKAIYEYEKDRPWVSNPRYGVQTSVRLYNFVKPLKDGECIIETYAACIDRHKKNKGRLRAKLVLSINTRDGRMRKRDLVYYYTYSSLAVDHWCADMTEYGLYHTNYMKRCGVLDEKMKWMYDRICRNENSNLPIVPILSSFEGTKYKYCAYTTESNISLFEYMRLFNIDSRIELLSKSGLNQFINEEFIAYFKDDNNFSKWFIKNWIKIKEKCRTNRGVFRMYGEKLHSETLERIAEERRIAAKKEEERLIRERIEERTKEGEKYNKQILNLYERLKGICKKYKAYDVIVPKDAREMVIEGEHMHNCIGAIHPRFQGKTECCIFLHKSGKPFIDISIDLTTFEVIDCRLVNNKEAEKEFWEDAIEIAKHIKETMKIAA